MLHSDHKDLLGRDETSTTRHDETPSDDSNSDHSSDKNSSSDKSADKAQPLRNAEKNEEHTVKKIVVAKDGSLAVAVSENNSMAMSHSDKSSDDGSDSSNDTSNSSSSDESKKNVGRKVVKITTAIGKEFKKLFIDYGPPYRKFRGENDAVTSLLHETLLNECCKPEAYLSEIHSLLNKRVNPNWRDPNDLYYCATHWCARRCHLRALKMLRRAKADVNIMNEFGQTPIILACLTKPVPDMQKKQLKTIQYLLDQGALIDVRDRGGYCAIDYAVMNQDEMAVSLLIKLGANMVRKNKMLVAQRKNLLSLAIDPNVKAIVKKRMNEVETQMAEEEAFQQRIREDELETRKRNLRLEEDVRNRELRAQAEKEEELRLFQDKILADRQKRIDDEVAGILKDKRLKPGDWEKKHQPGHWTLQRRDDEYVNITNEIFAESKKMMDQYRSDNKFDLFNDRWKQKTGGALEMDWNRDSMFKADDKVAKVDSALENPLDYRDENDDELEGVDMEDLLLTS